MSYCHLELEMRDDLAAENCRRPMMKLEKICRLCRRNRRGAAAVEFAFVAPVFFLFVFGMIEFGRMVMVQQVLTNASREGAREGILDGSTTADVTDAVTTYLTNSSISGASVAVTPSPPSSAGYGQPVTVTVTVPFDQVSWLPSPMFIGGRALTASTVMRRESAE
jgi:Flp pilus assembly protein TadG